MIRAIVVDDERLSLAFMEKKLNDIEDVQVVATFSDAESLVKEMNQVEFDVAFLDIDMGAVSGLELAECLLEHYPDLHIVFATAYQDYAIQAFELNSIDYLVKPVLKPRLEKTIARLKKRLEKTMSVVLVPERKVFSVSTFGELVVSYGGELIKWKTGKVKELFAFFLARYDTYIDRDLIIDKVWPHSDYKKAKIHLHTSIHYLRQLLKSVGYEQVITFSSNKYKLTLASFTCDHIDVIKANQQHLHVNEENISVLETVMKNYTGDFLEREGYDWATEMAATIKDHQLRLLEKMIVFYRLTRHKQALIATLIHYLKHNPYSEQHLRQLMMLYMEEGDRNKAIDWYRRTVKLLDEELGIDPEKETKTLYLQLIK